jgi:hypothetical protein
MSMECGFPQFEYLTKYCHVNGEPTETPTEIPWFRKKKEVVRLRLEPLI